MPEYSRYKCGQSLCDYRSFQGFPSTRTVIWDTFSPKAFPGGSQPKQYTVKTSQCLKN